MATRVFTGREMLCDKCGAFYGDEAAQTAVFCHKCDDHFYGKAFALGIYEKGLAATIINLKTSPILPEKVKREIASATGKNSLFKADILIPVPLSKLRKLERGYNQAEVIASEVARSTGISLDSVSLSRKLHTPIHRIGMDYKSRELTVRGAFEVLRPKLISGRNILLIDDVFTSGATASNCARVLKKNGSGEVNVFTLARAVLR